MTERDEQNTQTQDNSANSDNSSQNSSSDNQSFEAIFNSVFEGDGSDAKGTEKKPGGDQKKAASAKNDGDGNGQPDNSDSGQTTGTEDALKDAEAKEGKADKSSKESLAHVRWTAKEREVFNKLPDDVKRVWREQYDNLEAFNGRKMNDAREAFALQKEVDGLFTPDVVRQMQASGITKGQALVKLADFARQVEHDPVAAIRHIMARHNVNPENLLQNLSNGNNIQQQQHRQPDPQIAALMREVQALKSQQVEWQTRQNAEAESDIAATMAQFMDEADENGSPAHPYLENVADRMADLINHDPRYADLSPRQRLDEAYQVAIYSDPDIRAKILAAERSKLSSADEKHSSNERLKNAATSKSRSQGNVTNKTPSFQDIFDDVFGD